MSDHSRISRPILPGFTRGQTASRWTALLLLACYLPACSSWQVRGEPVPPIVADHPAEIQVTLDDGSKVMLKQPVIRGDTLSGLASRPTWNSPDSPTILATAPMSIALANIRHVALPGFSIGKTLGSIVGFGLIGALVAVGVVVAACNGRCILWGFGRGTAL